MLVLTTTGVQSKANLPFAALHLLLRPVLAEVDSSRARVLLAYGAWLRRRRRAAESRAPLRAAREIFETSGSRTPDAWRRLSPQELQIARMAAEGLSNRKIVQKLYRSHRTVGYHLYRVFPKLGITSRSEVATALA